MPRLGFLGTSTLARPLEHKNLQKYQLARRALCLARSAIELGVTGTDWTPAGTRQAFPPCPRGSAGGRGREGEEGVRCPPWPGPGRLPFPRCGPAEPGGGGYPGGHTGGRATGRSGPTSSAPRRSFGRTFCCGRCLGSAIPTLRSARQPPLLRDPRRPSARPCPRGPPAVPAEGRGGGSSPPPRWARPGLLPGARREGRPRPRPRGPGRAGPALSERGRRRAGCRGDGKASPRHPPLRAPAPANMAAAARRLRAAAPAGSGGR